MRKSFIGLIFVFGVANASTCSCVKFERESPEQMSRSDLIFRTDSQDGVFKREYIIPRQIIIPAGQIVRQQCCMRSDQMYENKQIQSQFQQQTPHQLSPIYQQISSTAQQQQQQFPLSNERFLQQTEQIVPMQNSETFIRENAIVRNEPIIREREHVIEDSMIPSSNVFYENGPRPILQNDQSNYAIVISQCPCQQNLAQAPWESFIQVQQPYLERPIILLQKVKYEKPDIFKRQILQPIITLPGVSRFISKPQNSK